jgi:hypothetical protein
MRMMENVYQKQIEREFDGNLRSRKILMLCSESMLKSVKWPGKKKKKSIKSSDNLIMGESFLPFSLYQF